MDKMYANLKKLAALKEANPFITHIYMRRADEVSVDIPISHADFTIRQHLDWTVEDSGIAEGTVPTAPATFVAPPLPPKPSEEAATAEAKPAVSARLSRAKLEELALEEGITQDEINAAEEKGDLVALVNLKRGAGEQVEEETA